MTKIVNLTPHAIVLRAPDGTEHSFLPSTVARVAVQSVPVDTYADLPVPLVESKYGEVEGLPAAQPPCPECGVRPGEERPYNNHCSRIHAEPIFYLVSRIVKDRVPERKDVLVPDALLRDGQGRVVAAMRLSL